MSLISNFSKTVFEIISKNSQRGPFCPLPPQTYTNLFYSSYPLGLNVLFHVAINFSILYVQIAQWARVHHFNTQYVNRVKWPVILFRLVVVVVVGGGVVFWRPSMFIQVCLRNNKIFFLEAL